MGIDRQGFESERADVGQEEEILATLVPEGAPQRSLCGQCLDPLASRVKVTISILGTSGNSVGSLLLIHSALTVLNAFCDPLGTHLGKCDTKG